MAQPAHRRGPAEQLVDHRGGAGEPSPFRLTLAGVVEHHRPAVGDVRGPQVPVQAGALARVVAVDEHDVDRCAVPAPRGLLARAHVPAQLRPVGMARRAADRALGGALDPAPARAQGVLDVGVHEVKRGSGGHRLDELDRRRALVDAHLDHAVPRRRQAAQQRRLPFGVHRPRRDQPRTQRQSAQPRRVPQRRGREPAQRRRQGHGP